MQKNDFIGLEDSLELKSRFYSVQCSSDRGTINKIRILDFIVFIASNHSLDLHNMFKYVNDRKKTIIERIQNNLLREIKNSKRAISYAYSIALSSYETKKKFNVKIKKDNIYNINHKSILNPNEKLIWKIKELAKSMQTNNINIECKEKEINSKRKRPTRFKRTLLLNQNSKNEEKNFCKKNQKWFDEKNEYFHEKSRKKIKTEISPNILMISNSDRKIKSYYGKIPKNFLNNIYNYDKTFSKSNKNVKIKKIFPEINLTITPLYNKKYDFSKNHVLSYINRRMDKEITNMAGIYDTKREISKKKLNFPSSPKNSEGSQNIKNNCILIHSNYLIQNRINMMKYKVLTSRNKSDRLNSKNKSIPNINNDKIRKYINK